MLQEILTLFQKDLKLEWRQRYAISSIFLYIISAIFIVFLSFNARVNQLNPNTWNALFWIIMLFTAISSITKTFLQEKQSRHFYYYTVVSPQAVILAKILYNVLLMLLLSMIAFISYTLLLGNPIQDQWLFILNLALGAIGFSTSLTMVANIATKAENNGTLMAILSFPIIIPMLLMLIKVSKNAMDGLDRGASLNEIFIIVAMNVILMVISYILFPYLWKN